MDEEKNLIFFWGGAPRERSAVQCSAVRDDHRVRLPEHDEQLFSSPPSPQQKRLYIHFLSFLFFTREIYININIVRACRVCGVCRVGCLAPSMPQPRQQQRRAQVLLWLWLWLWMHQSREEKRRNGELAGLCTVIFPFFFKPTNKYTPYFRYHIHTVLRRVLQYIAKVICMPDDSSGGYPGASAELPTVPLVTFFFFSFSFCPLSPPPARSVVRETDTDDR